MRRFASLYATLDATTSSNAKIAAMVGYFRSAPADDAAWAVYFLAGGKPRQLVPTRVLRDFTLRQTGLPEWLFEECYQGVGDLAETISLLIEADPAESHDETGLAEWLETRLLPLRGLPAQAIIERLAEDWPRLDPTTRFVCTKLITGAFRVGVSRLLVTRALGEVAGVDPKRVAERLIGYTDLRNRPDADQYLRLLAAVETDELGEVGEVGDAGSGDRPMAGTQPYPFFLAHPLTATPAELTDRLGDPADWLIEWKWDGIRAQLVRRNGRVAVWSRGEELVTERFPELAALGEHLPDGTVLDGEIVVQLDGEVQPFALLQKRLGRKLLSARILTDAPVCLLAYDLLEQAGRDRRADPQATRRAALEASIAAWSAQHPEVDRVLRLSPRVIAPDWPALDVLRQDARSRSVEGLMLKALGARYGVGRTRDVGVWWKWKIDPYSVDAVLIYAQRGHGRRAGLFSDYTFGVWADDGSERRLVPFAKAYSGLTDAEMREVDAIIRRTTIEKFGPVSSVEPSLVFELGFEGIARSSRHRSGIAVRFPRMLRWRRDKPPLEADSLTTLAALLPQSSTVR